MMIVVVKLRNNTMIYSVCLGLRNKILNGKLKTQLK